MSRVSLPALPSDWVAEVSRVRSADDKVELHRLLLRAEPWRHGRALVVFHGMGEHSGRYLHVPHFLREEVGAVFASDWRGHGRSEGVRGDVPHFDALAEDGVALIEEVRADLLRRFGRAEIHVLAHSLGAHVFLRALRLKADLPVASASLSAPFLGIKAKVPPVKKAAARVLARLWPSLPLATGLDAKALCSDPAVVDAYRCDPLNHGKMTPRFFEGLLRAFDETLAAPNGITVPIQFLVPLADEVVDEQKVLAFYEALRHEKKALRTYEGFFHEPLNETGKERVFADVAAWIRKHRRDE